MMRALAGAALSAVALLCWAPAAVAEDLCSDLGGTIEDDGMCRTHSTGPDYTLDLAFPVDFPDQAAVTDFVTSTRDEFIDTAGSRDGGPAPYALDVTASLVASDVTRSVTFEVYQNVGGAHPNTWYKSFNYDIVEQRPITFETLFDPEARPLSSIYPVVVRELTARTGQLDPVAPSAGLDAANYQNFAITPHDVIFFFDRGALMAGAAGAQKVYVPRSEIPPLAI